MNGAKVGKTVKGSYHGHKWFRCITQGCSKLFYFVNGEPLTVF